jgi:hypothetical protein
MNITVKNTTPDTTRITLVGELQDGSFKAKVMPKPTSPTRLTGKASSSSG